jgi:hypothetical protein
MTNGRGEKHNQFSKGIGTRMAPANYSNQALVIANGSAIQYKKDLLRLVTGLGLTWGLNVCLVKRCLFKSI